MQIIPALLEPTSVDLVGRICRLAPYFNRFQIDIADGIYVPNQTLSIENALTELANNQSLIAYHLSFDFHLMTKTYKQDLAIINRFSHQLKIGGVLVHFDLSPEYLMLTTNHSFPIGLVINPHDQIDDLVNRFAPSTISLVQVMSVVPGTQGQTFIPETLKKVEQLRLAGYRNEIFLDGGINNHALPFILRQHYQPDALCIGSYLVNSDDIAFTLEELKGGVNKFNI